MNVVKENSVYRTGIEDGFGRQLRFKPTQLWHTHYCAEHDHNWRCEVDPCTWHETRGCGA